MSIKYVLLLPVVIALTCTAYSQDIHPWNHAVIWRGFNHDWTYNHRCNRIGDYVQLRNDSVFATHTSATGTGPDDTYDTSYYSTVATADCAFMQGQDVLLIHGFKDSLIVVRDTVYITCPKWMKDKHEYITLLNGFDLSAYNSEAEKPQALYLNVGDAVPVAWPSPDSVTLQLVIRAGAVLNCTTPECHHCNHILSYKLSVFYLIAGTERNRSAASSQLFTTGYSWNKQQQMKEPPVKDFIEGADNPAFKAAVVGIKSFTLAMDKDHWLIQWNNSIQMVKEKGYNPDNARIGVTINQEFVDWKLGMNHSTVPGSDAFWAYKQRGWEIMNINAEMLQFTENTTIKNSHVTLKMHWNGHNEPIDTKSDIAVSSRPF